MSVKGLSQEFLILKYLKTGKGLTSLDALRLFNCWRLAARICELRDKGYDIHTQTIEDGINNKRYAKYWLRR